MRILGKGNTMAIQVQEITDGRRHNSLQISEAFSGCTPGDKMSPELT
jgi:hypothetical protein